MENGSPTKQKAVEIEPFLAYGLLEELQRVRQLQGALIKTKEHSHWITRSYSAGMRGMTMRPFCQICFGQKGVEFA
jgi:hypothetical protein